MKIVKIHFCDGKGYEMKEIWVTPDSWKKPVKYYVCPMCDFTLLNGKKAKGILTVKKEKNDQNPQSQDGPQSEGGDGCPCPGA